MAPDAGLWSAGGQARTSDTLDASDEAQTSCFTIRVEGRGHRG